MMTTVITWKYIFSMRAKTWSCEKLLWIGTCCKGVRREGVEGILTDKINYAMLDLAVVIPFSIGFIRILIRFCIHSSSCFSAAKDSTSCRLSRLKGFFFIFLLAFMAVYEETFRKRTVDRCRLKKKGQILRFPELSLFSRNPHNG